MVAFDFKDTLAAVASITTILQFLSGILVCQKYVRNGTTGEASGLAFVMGLTSCSMWLQYGMLINDAWIIIVNIFGSSLQILYVLIFMSYSIKKSLSLKQLSSAIFFIASVYIYCHYEIDRALARQRIGLLSCGMTIIFFASPLTMLSHVLRVKSAESLPFPIIVSTLIVSSLWLVYGILINDTFMTIPNILGCFLSTFQLSLFILYPGKKSDQIHIIQS